MVTSHIYIKLNIIFTYSIIEKKYKKKIIKIDLNYIKNVLNICNC